jgi:hypothetical protein
MDNDYLTLLKENYTKEDFLKNTVIMDILEEEHKYYFMNNFRSNIENIKQKYYNLYNYVDIFKNDKNNVNWERLYDIIYEYTSKNYNIDIIYNNPEYFIDILEK